MAGYAQQLGQVDGQKTQEGKLTALSPGAAPGQLRRREEAAGGGRGTAGCSGVPLGQPACHQVPTDRHVAFG